MLENQLLIIISLLFIVSMLAIASEKLQVSYPILLVVAGLGISLVPGIPVTRFHPNLVFIIFLPPLLYSAAWNMPWKDFWALKRPISMLAFGLVFFTAGAVALVAHAVIPGFSLSLGLLLGGIISPPDAVAATSIIGKLKVPKRIVIILEGESLVNDASSLIVFRLALSALFTGQFVAWKAGVDFLLVASMGIVIGVAIAFVIYLIHRFLPTTSSIDTAITLMGPYLMYIAAEHFHFSGVLAVVSGGLFLSYRAQKMFDYNSRLQAQSVWNVLVFILNGTVFILIGLQLRDIVKGLGEYSLQHAIWYAVIITFTAILVRILWVFPGAYLPWLLNRKKPKTEPKPGWKSTLVIAWSGMRGVVSLASALSIPLTLNDNAAFPHRNLILFITFLVILITLVMQGLSLPFLINKIKLHVNDYEEVQHKHALRLHLAKSALKHMQTNYKEESATIDAFRRLHDRYERIIENNHNKLEAEEGTDTEPDFLKKYRTMLLELVAVRRQELDRLRGNDDFTDEMLREKETELDLEEARLRF